MCSAALFLAAAIRRIGSREFLQQVLHFRLAVVSVVVDVQVYMSDTFRIDAFDATGGRRCSLRQISFTDIDRHPSPMLIHLRVDVIAGLIGRKLGCRALISQTYFLLDAPVQVQVK